MRGLKLSHPLFLWPEMKSHPLRVRGLKSLIFIMKERKKIVAPSTGAWIEIRISPKVLIPLLLSHPLRVRGLKFKSPCKIVSYGWSHPLRVRGLKYGNTGCTGRILRVAPSTGAWIEIFDITL